MNRKEANKLEAEMSNMGLRDEEGATTNNQGRGTDADDAECDCEECRPVVEANPSDENAESQPEWAAFCPAAPGPFGGRQGRGPWACYGGKGPFNGRKCGPFGPMSRMARAHGMGPMAGPMGGYGMGHMNFMGGHNMGGHHMGPHMGGPGMGPFGPMGPGGFGPFRPFSCRGDFKRFGGPDKLKRGPPQSGCHAEEDETESADAKKERRQKRRQERREAAAAAREESKTLESSGEEDNEDITQFLPPWMVRFIRMKKRMANASGPQKEKIRQKMRCMAMKRYMIAQQHQQAPWWTHMMGGDSTFMGPPFMGPHFGGPMGPWCMRPRFGRRHGRRCGGRMGGPPMWLGSEESDSDDQKDQTTPHTVETEDFESQNNETKAAEAGEQMSSDDDEEQHELPHNLPPWMVNMIKMKRQMVKARVGCDTDKKQQRRWARCCMTANGAPWGGPGPAHGCQRPMAQGPPIPAFFWAMQENRPKMWKKMMKQHRRAAMNSTDEDTDAEVTERCEHCGNCGATN